ncbi:helicase [Maribacter sp. MJ134]|uniref:helicase-related protein n=1 Tax=Maribacter sp. MJ134 TaxID=2496865 RepID=UPI000F84B1FD|nr:helicase-related protein [Maribacter sp. MJ134]AZQ58100.1 helicase [Maribacter sp. MJ134]
MSKYINEPRLIFRDTIKNNLIGPGSDVFVSNSEEEIISNYPLSRYFSGILFPEREEEKTIGEKQENDTNAEIEDDKLDDVDDSAPEIDNSEVKEEDVIKKSSIEAEKEYSEANQYFPTNFGLTFCVPKETKSVNVTFNFAKYKQIKKQEAEVEISLNDFEIFTKHNYYPLSDLLLFENGSMVLNPKSPLFNAVTVYNLRKYFEDENNVALRNTKAYYAADLLLGQRLWKRVRQKPIELTLNLNEANVDESKEYALEEDAENKRILTCYYKKVYETDYGRFIKILMANREEHSKKKFSLGNEQLNAKAIFQGEVVVSGTSFKPYKQLSETNPFDEELNLINFQYREEHSYAIGHGCAVTWDNPKKPTELKTTFLPEVEIKNYSNSFRNNFPEELKSITSLRKLSIWTDLKKDIIIEKLKLFANQYQDWIKTTQEPTRAEESYKESLDEIINNQKSTYNRLIKNIDFLANNEVAFKSFQLANTSMFIQMLISNKNEFGTKGIELNELNSNINYNSLDFFKENTTFNPQYRPFQLAFFLLNIESIINEKSNDRNDIVDLLWFPTGGGKTEAYLALTAFSIISRRISHKSNADGVSVIMRYTLRLLTAQQFDRATKLILSLDFLRRQFDEGHNYFFGTSKISIGMWVGASTTPNYFKDAKSIHKKILDEITKLNSGKIGDYKKVNSFPITNCSWCGCNLVSQNKLGYYQQGYSASTSSFLTKCINENCSFSDELPIYFVDDKIYTTPPTLLFATVDKFAMLSHRKEGHRLFNSLPINNPKLPPDLIIQDELHLLSGPLGSITGLYESIVELLSTKGSRKPKIIASTATTRNTKHQVAMLYGNRKLNVFPPMGAAYNDNFFSFVSENSKRKHIGFMPTGKTALNSQIRILGNLLLARIELFKYFKEKENLNAEEIKKYENNFWTIVSFYNSLRDVGKIYNKVPAEITDFIKLLHTRYNLNKQAYGFNYFGLSSRTKELTSRVESNSIKNLLNELEQPFDVITSDNGWRFVKNTVDLVLASNMFSVGIDIERLNVMLMNGQPKNVAEYIQASSRVGRKEQGIVINLLDANRSRDKSYFENYVPFNTAYYKYVEPLSVTPFTEISLDKVLASLLVCFVRHKLGLSEDKQAKDFDGNYQELKEFISNRIKNRKQLDYALNKLESLAEKWNNKEGELTYKILIKKISDLDEWSLMMSMREIDTNSIIKITNK